MRLPRKTSVLLAGTVLLLLFAALAYGGVESWSNATCVIGALALGTAAAFLEKPRLLPELEAAARIPVRAVLWVLVALGILLAIQVLPLGTETVRRLSPGSAFAYGFDHGGPRHLSTYLRGTLLASARIGAFAFFLFALLRALDSRRQIMRLAGALALLGFALALFGIIQKLAWNGRIYWIGSTASNPFGPFVNRNHFAGFMVLLTPLSIGYFLGSHRRGRRVGGGDEKDRDVGRTLRLAIQGVMGATMFLAALMSFSRGGAVMILLAVTGICAAVLIGRRRPVSERFKALLLVLAAITALWLGVGYGWERIGTLFSPLKERSFSMRLHMWQDMVTMWHDFPLFGSGFGTFHKAFLPYRTFGRSEQALIFGHNDGLQLLTEGGAVGFLIVATGCLVFLFSALGALRLRRDKQAVHLVRGGLIGLSAFIFHSLGTFNFHIPANYLAFAAVVALTLAALRSSERKHA